jgi:uncharacterized protein YjiS (DUF1127 family)
MSGAPSNPRRFKRLHALSGKYDAPAHARSHASSRQERIDAAVRVAKQRRNDMHARTNVIRGSNGDGRFLELHPAAAAIHAITEFGRHIAYAARMRRDRELLNEMSDYMLRDIGITRNDINFVTPMRRRDSSRRARG